VRVAWFLLPAVAVVLLLAVTNTICQEVAVVPFLWVLPLSVYLVTLVLCFARGRRYRRGVFVPAMFVAAAGVCLVLLQPQAFSIAGEVFVYLAALFVLCMALHGELAGMRPEGRGGDEEDVPVTSFYLAVAAGGAAGGVLVGVVAPVVFSGFWELHLGVAAAMGLVLARLAVARDSALRLGQWPGVWVAMVVGWVLVAYVLATNVQVERARTVAAERNFYGVVGVYRLHADEPRRERLVMRHGGTIHGLQFVQGRRRAVSYYGPESGAGVAIRVMRDRGERNNPSAKADPTRVIAGGGLAGEGEGNRYAEAYPTGGREDEGGIKRRGKEAGGLKVGVLGLGVGTLAAETRAGDVMRFYEINPAVVRMAREQFTYLADATGGVEVVTGDARMTMEREAAQGYDVLVLDAFTGDSPPVHLLTTEAFEVYRKHVRPGGVIAVNISNRHFDLRGVVEASGKHVRMRSVWVDDPYDNEDLGHFASDWMVMTDDTGVLADERLRAVAKAWEGGRGPVWTDDQAAVWSVYK
jgi:hypothetical protein